MKFGRDDLNAGLKKHFFQILIFSFKKFLPKGVKKRIKTLYIVLASKGMNFRLLFLFWIEFSHVILYLLCERIRVKGKNKRIMTKISTRMIQKAIKITNGSYH